MVLDHVQERRKIIEALKVIKETCKKSPVVCHTCPLYIPEGLELCHLHAYDPEKWVFNDSLEGGADWRAFK